MALKTYAFDASEYVDDDEAAVEFLKAAAEDEDPSTALAMALGTVAKARGMTEIARAAGLSREALYKALLREDSQPRLDTIMRVCTALGLRLTVERAA